MTQINTTAIQNFIRQVKEADLSQKKEIKLDIKTAKSLVFCLSEISSRLLMDYDELINKLSQPKEDIISIQMDGGDFTKNGNTN
jgi:hypothetical protein